MDDVSQSLHQYWFPDGARLHIEAEVMDQASGHKEKAFDWSIAFALRPIRIAVDETRFYFKPGLNHELHVSFLETRTRFFSYWGAVQNKLLLLCTQIQTIWVNRHEAKRIPFSLAITTTSRYGISEESPLHRLQTDDTGRFTYNLSTRALDDRIQFRVFLILLTYMIVYLLIIILKKKIYVIGFTLFVHRYKRFLPTQQASLTVDISAMRTTSRAFIGIQATKVMNS